MRPLAIHVRPTRQRRSSDLETLLSSRSLIFRGGTPPHGRWMKLLEEKR